MKKVFYIAGIVLMYSCGGSATDETAAAETGTTDSTTTAEIGPLEDNSIIDPLKDDLSGLIQATDLIKSMTIYYNKEIQLIVYPRVYTDGEAFKQGMYGAATADGNEYSVSMTFTTLPTEGVVKGQPYLIKGIFKEIGTYDELRMADVEILALPADYKTTPFNPKAISSTYIYDPATIIANIKAWDKKIITVIGDFWGSTISKSYDKTELYEARADLGTTESKMGCAFPTEAEAKAFEPGQKGVKIKGELSSKLQFGTSPKMINCSVVN